MCETDPSPPGKPDAVTVCMTLAKIVTAVTTIGMLIRTLAECVIQPVGPLLQRRLRPSQAGPSPDNHFEHCMSVIVEARTSPPARTGGGCRAAAHQAAVAADSIPA